MRVLILGAGAIGGYLGARLARAERDVTFLVRPARADLLRRDGLVVESPHGDFRVTPQLLGAGAIAAPFDVVILAVKAFALEAALDDVAPAIGPDTMLLPFLNGMRHLDLLDARFGSDRVLGGLARIHARLDAQGRVVQLAPLHDFVYGERDGSRSARIERLDAELRHAAVDASLSTRIVQDMWDKWVLLAALGTVTCLIRGTVGEIASVDAGADTARRIVAELASIAAALGHPPAEATVGAIRRMLGDPASKMTSSMYRDLVQGDATEVEQILGDLLARAAPLSLDVPLLAAATAQLRVLEARRTAAGRVRNRGRGGAAGT